jgi:hypothetical protein
LRPRRPAAPARDVPVDGEEAGAALPALSR